MRINQEDTPPSSVDGDEVRGMEEDGIFYLDDLGVEIDEEDLETFMETAEGEMPTEDHAFVVFEKHNGSIFCCDLHPSGKIAVTGGEDDKAYVWSTMTGDLITECTGHKDSVIYVGFSFDAHYLATVDMCGLIKVWKCPEGYEEPKDAWTVAFEYEAEDLTWAQWHFGTRVLICGAVSGDIYILKIPSGDIKILQGHHSKTECGKIFPDGVRLAAGYEDGVVKVWDLKTSSILQQLPANVHEGRVSAIDTNPDNNLMASVSSDGKVVLTTSSNGKVIAQLGAETDIESVVFAQDPQLPYFALGTLQGDVNIWDTSRQMVRHSLCKSSDNCVPGVTKMFWIKNHLVTGCLDGSVRVYEGRSGDKTLMLSGHMSEILDICYNAPLNVLLTASDDGSARVFKYDVNKDND